MLFESVDFFRILECLASHRVKFVVVGGVSALLNGAPVMTFDLDVVHERSEENVQALLEALRELNAYHRHHPVRIEPKASHLSTPGHQLLHTSCGPLDLLGQIDGGKGYEDLVPLSHVVEVEAHSYLILGLNALIDIKQRANRDKDRAVLPVLRAALEEQ